MFLAPASFEATVSSSEKSKNSGKRALHRDRRHSQRIAAI
jgi:hypothetical protein